VTVLKGLAATVTYGDQGRNGVILVTTKNGSQKARKSEISVTQSVFTNNANLPRYQNTYVGGFQGNLGYFFSNWGPSLEEAQNYPSQNTNRGLTTHPYAFLVTQPQGQLLRITLLRRLRTKCRFTQTTSMISSVKD
jgi:hypothetical protein